MSTQISVRKSEESGLALVQPKVWPSRVFPGVQIAVSVADVQALYRSKHGPPPVADAQQFLLFCAGWGVDPRIGQAFLIPFEETSPTGQKCVIWQRGLAYDVFRQFAEQTGVVLGDRFRPPVREWPKEFDPDFWVEIEIVRKPPLLPIVYGAYLRELAQMRDNKLARAWRDDKVGWRHMAQVRLIARGYRLATGLSRAYLAEEFQSAGPEGYEEAVVIPPAEEAEAGMAAQAAPAPETAGGAGAEAASEPAAAAAAAPEPDPWEDELPAEPQGRSEGEPEETPAEQMARHIAGLSDEEVAAELKKQLRSRHQTGQAIRTWVEQALGRPAGRMSELTPQERRELLTRHWEEALRPLS